MNTVIRLEFTAGERRGEVHYVDKIATIYEHFTPQEVGAVQAYLYNNCITVDNPAVTKRCIISKHTVLKNQKLRERRKKDEE